MSVRTPAVTRRALAIDTGIAVLAFGLTVAMLGARGLGTPDPATRPDDGLGTLLAMAAALPLVVRRVAPLWVFAATAVASLSLLGLDYGLDVPFGVLVATYGAAEAYGGPERPARRRAAMLGAAGFVPVAVAMILLGGVFRSGQLVPGLLVWALLFIGAWIAGDRTRLRRERISELEERAARAERERERERRLAAAEERTRIARELHDSAGHAVNVILVQAGAARLLHDSNPERSRQAIASIEELARSTAAEIDQLVRVLRSDDGAEPAPADPSALEELVQQHRAGGLEVSTSIEGDRRALPQGIAWASYRIVQEALTNAARHGRGSADLQVRFGADAVEITVTNPTGPQPTGPQPAGPPPPARNGSGGGHGIVGMQERATLLGGELAADQAGDSFRVHARLPHQEVA